MLVNGKMVVEMEMVFYGMKVESITDKLSTIVVMDFNL
jgi:hypothetical protein